MRDQLILTDAALCVIGAVLPPGRIAGEIAAARDAWGGGELHWSDLPRIEALLSAARGGLTCVVAADAVRGALIHFRAQAAQLARIRDVVSVHVWDASRDGEPPCIVAGRLPKLPAGARWE